MCILHAFARNVINQHIRIYFNIRIYLILEYILIKDSFRREEYYNWRLIKLHSIVVN